MLFSFAQYAVHSAELATSVGAGPESCAASMPASMGVGVGGVVAVVVGVGVGCVGDVVVVVGEGDPVPPIGVTSVEHARTAAGTVTATRPRKR
jgi:hypothetical protein